MPPRDARSRNDLFGLARRLPWPRAAALAVLSYFICHHFAVTETAAAIELAEVGPVTGLEIVRTAARIGQYLLPAIFGAAALKSWLIARRRAREEARGAPATRLRRGVPPPLCPTCGAHMTLRSVRADAGGSERHWECVRAPDCAGRRAV